MIAMERKGLEVPLEWEVSRLDDFSVKKRGIGYYDRDLRGFFVKDVQVFYERGSCAGAGVNGQDVFGRGKREQWLAVARSDLVDGADDDGDSAE